MNIADEVRNICSRGQRILKEGYVVAFKWRRAGGAHYPGGTQYLITTPDGDSWTATEPWHATAFPDRDSAREAAMSHFTKGQTDILDRIVAATSVEKRYHIRVIQLRVLPPAEVLGDFPLFQAASCDAR